MTPIRSRRVGATVSAAPLLVAALVGAPSAASAKTADPWWFSTLHLADAHKKTTGKGVTIAVIDTGLDPTIPDLKGADIEFGAACAPRGKKSLPRVHDFEANHGTAMTTLIVGQGKGNGPGGAGITGVAPDATVRFYDYTPNPRLGAKECGESEIGYLFRQAVEDKVDIISFSTTSVFSLDVVIEDAIEAGIVVVAGGGKPDESISSPASIPGVVSVLAFDKNGRAWKHNPGMKLSLTDDSEAWEFGYPVISAPGVDVPAGAMDRSGAWGSRYPRTGTSDATPMVAGMLALLKSAHPKATGNQLIQQLIHYPGAGESLQWDAQFGFGAASITQMLKGAEPTQWPDINPLLNGPKQAIEDFPIGSNQDAKPTPAPAKQAVAKPAANDSSGTPVWIWLTAVLALALLVAALIVLRRRRTPADSVTTPSDIPEEARS
jgi:MYXO-CTERM domain-containing protein